MFPENPQYPGRQSGSMLVIALFIIVVLTALGLLMTQLLQASTDRVIHEVYGLRAATAAQTGLERKMSEIFFQGAGCSNDPAPISLTNTTGMETCQVQASCEQLDFAADNLTYYRLSSQGICAGGTIITSRTLAVEAAESL